MKNSELPTDLLKYQLREMQIKIAEESRSSYLTFVKKVWPEFIAGKHHKIYAQKLEDVATGKIKRLIINMPPRHTKSEFASNLFPAWMMGRNPKLKIIQTTHTAELSYNFGRKVRNLFDQQEFKDVFPAVSLSQDSKAAGRFTTNKGGEYFAAGVGGAITGRGADLLIIDDPHSEQDALSQTAMDNAYEWYTSGPRQRLQPGGSIVIVMTRWSTKDLTGKLLKAQSNDNSDQWDVVEFPAILNDKPMWPEFWKLAELESVKAALSEQKWQAQWQQQPTSEEGSIIKREWWKVWTLEKIPDLMHVIQSYDTAFSKKETADFSAITTWGVFKPVEHGPWNIILLDMKKGRWDFPDLKKVALDEYTYWEPETILIEAKASGMPLTQELRQLGIPVVTYTPSKGNDKHVRVNSVAPLFEAGQVWCTEDRWADEVVEECAAFPFGEHDDLVDSTTQALLRFRQGNFIQLDSDYQDEPKYIEPRSYY
jgi:predicted phage terminase large subunit-like protein